MSNPEQEGDALYAEAKKASGTTLFRWKPDWEKAQRLFDAAANKYCHSPKLVDKQVAALRGAAAAAEEMSATNLAARHLIKASSALVRAGRKVDSVSLSRAGASLFHQNNQARKAAEELAKAAALMRDVDDEEAVKLYFEALDVFEMDDSTSIGSDTYKAALAFMVKKKRLQDAIDVLQRQNRGLMSHIQSFSATVFRNYVSIVALYLGLRDISKAVQSIMEFQDSVESFGSSNEYLAASKLAQAFQDCDEDQLEKAKKDRTFSYIDNQVARLVRDLTIDEDAVASARSFKSGALAALGNEDSAEELDLT